DPLQQKRHRDGGDLRDHEQHEREEHAAAKRPRLRGKRQQDAFFRWAAHARGGRGHRKLTNRRSRYRANAQGRRFAYNSARTLPASSRAVMSRRTIAIVATGEMGSAVGAALVEGGYRVVTDLTGRSAQSRKLAARAGIED